MSIAPDNETAQGMTRVVVIDDHPLIRKALSQLFGTTSDFVLVGEAASGTEGRAAVLALSPDLVVLDLDLGREAEYGVNTLRALRDSDFDGRIVILTVSDSPEDLAAAIRAGADGYLLKDVAPEDLLACFRDAVAGRTAISSGLAGVLASAIRSDAGGAVRRMDRLTDRERDILALLTLGPSNKLIAIELDIAEGTVKVHLKSMLKKLGFRSRLEAAVWAIEQGVKAAPLGTKRIRRPV